MEIKKFLFPAFLVGSLLLLIRRLFARTASVKPDPKRHSFDAVDAYIEEQLGRLNIPGASLAIVEGDQVVHLRGFGRARPGAEAPSPQTSFFIGSLTKSFTALAIMQLVEAGKVDLDAPVQHYLPWFRVADPQTSAQMTVRHLLNQTSGFSQPAGIIPLANFDDRPDAAERQARELSTYRLAHPPGSTWDYCNLNYNLLGLVIQAASGVTYADYIQEHIFNSLEMKHSYTSKPAAKGDGLAVGHMSCFGVSIPVPDLPVPSGSLPSGQLISSAEDMAHYLIAHLNGGSYGNAQILSPEGIAEIHRPAVKASEMGIEFGAYGMGWMIEATGQGRRIFHKGTEPDFFAYMALLPEKNLGFVLLANANHLMIDFALNQVGSNVTSLLAGVQPKPLQLGVIPWVQRAPLLIPVIQIAGIAATLRLLGRWHRDPALRPSAGRKWGQHILLPLIPNLSLAAIPLFLQGSKLLRSMLLYLPDFSWIALICGSISGIWAFLRTGLILRTLRKTASINGGRGQCQ